MAGGNWQDPDGLFRQYGTSKAVPTTAGDYLSYGEWRDIEFTVTLSALSATPTIIANTTFLGTNVFIESVNVDMEVAAAGGTSLSVGTMRLDRSTVVSNTNIVNALVTASMTQGASTTMTGGSTSAGALVGTTVTTAQLPDGAAYITATAAGTFTTGVAKVRIRYRGIGTITQ
jgi:hypothetical protein